MKFFLPWSKIHTVKGVGSVPDYSIINILDIGLKNIAYISFYSHTVSYGIGIHRSIALNLNMAYVATQLKDMGYTINSSFIYKVVNDVNVSLDMLKQEVIQILTVHFEYRLLDSKQILLL